MPSDSASCGARRIESDKWVHYEPMAATPTPAADVWNATQLGGQSWADGSEGPAVDPAADSSSSAAGLTLAPSPQQINVDRARVHANVVSTDVRNEILPPQKGGNMLQDLPKD